MIEIGTTFDYYWEDDYGGDYDEEVTVCGYVYYQETLYYVCFGEETETQVDVHYRDAEEACADD